jgi:CheY-like chemotaxis protein
MMSAILSPVILMLEPDPDDRYITVSVFEEHNYQAHLEFVSNGEGLFAYLDHCRQSGLSYPALVLMNLHTTPQDGREVLKQLKASPDYKHIPVVVLSGSADGRIARECYALGASSFIQKPAPLREIHEKIASFFRYWFETVVLAS